MMIFRNGIEFKGSIVLAIWIFCFIFIIELFVISSNINLIAKVIFGTIFGLIGLNYIQGGIRLKRIHKVVKHE